jgi:gamma-glutamyltranspeptidase / glutathione hydrolase
MRRAFAALVCFVFVSFASGTERGPGKAAIASAHPAASAAGHEMLERGGNAFDAAVAVAAALTVVEPTGSGLGGGGFVLLHRASDGRNVMIDAREKAPGASTRDMFLDAQGNPDRKRATESALAAGIPGEPAALEHLATKYGKLPLATSMAPAIRLARDGFPLYERLRDGMRQRVPQFKRTPDAERAFLIRGDVPPLGHRIRQPELAATLESVAKHGARKGFYSGPVAKKLVKGAKEFGGIWTEEDLAAYEVVEREPLVADYRGVRIVTASLPASGGVGLIDALNILEGFDLAALDPVTRKHVVVEAMRRVHRDRAVYLGDPDFVKAPVEMLTSQHYADGQRTTLRLDRALPSAAFSGIETEASSGAETTHFSIIDAEGNRVAATFTLNLWFGTGLMAPGTGVLFNNQMDDFAIKAGAPNAYELVGAEANAIEPGKRPLSSSTPTFVESERGIMIGGTPGGSRILGMVLLATLDFLDGRSPADIVAAPRYHHQYLPDQLEYEPKSLSEAERKALEARGHTLREGRRRWGNLQLVVWDRASGEVQAANDPRGAVGGVAY